MQAISIRDTLYYLLTLKAARLCLVMPFLYILYSWFACQQLIYNKANKYTVHMQRKYTVHMQRKCSLTCKFIMDSFDIYISC